MKTNDFYTSLSSRQIQENLVKQFGTKVSLGKYTREELEDMRNKLRTRVFQQEHSNGYNDLLTNEAYQKDMAMLQLLNTRIKEMLGEDIKKLKDKMIELSEGKKGVKVAKHSQGSKGTDQTGDGKSNFDDVQVARMVAGGVPKKQAIAKATSDNVKEETGKFDKTDTTWTDKSGNKHPAQRVTRKTDQLASGSDDAPKDKKAKDKNKDLGEATKDCNHTPKGEKCPVHGMKECGSMYEASHQEKVTMKHVNASDASPKVKAAIGKAAKKIKPGVPGYGDRAAALDAAGIKRDESVEEGKDEFAKGKNFAKIAKAAGGGEKGDRIAGAIRAEKIKKAGGKVKYAKESVSVFKHNVRFVNESLQFLLAEDEEGKAKAITAASDIVNDYTSWMQRVGQYQTKAIIELADAIKADFGAAEAEAFKQSVAPALAATLETLTAQRETISNAVAVLAGEAAPEEPMGMEPEMPPEPEMDTTSPDEMNPEPAGDEFGAADAAGAGRAVRESKFSQKLAESHSIISKLAK